jgi:hypothetical protein
MYDQAWLVSTACIDRLWTAIERERFQKGEQGSDLQGEGNL